MLAHPSAHVRKQILPNILRQSQNTLITFLHGSLFYSGYFTTKGSERQNRFLPVFETRYHYPLFPSGLTRGRTGQQNEGVEFRRKPETPQAEPLRPEEGRGLPCAPGTGVTPGQEANPGAGARSYPQIPPRRPMHPRSVEVPARPPQAPEAKGGGNRAPVFTPAPPEARPHGGTGTPGRRCGLSFPPRFQLLPTWRRPWPPGAGPRGRRAAGQQARGPAPLSQGEGRRA